MIDAKLITTAQEIPGYRVARNFGVVRGIIVRSRSLLGNIGASLQTLFGWGLGGNNVARQAGRGARTPLGRAAARGAAAG